MAVPAVRLAAVVLALALSVASCGDDAETPAAVDSLDSLCQLAKMPHATYEQRKALLADAQHRIAQIGGFAQTVHNKAINKAITDVVAAISVETPPDWPGAPLPRPASIPTVATAFQRLDAACG